jgi:hypothetical protein
MFIGYKYVKEPYFIAPISGTFFTNQDQIHVGFCFPNTQNKKWQYFLVPQHG